MGSGTPVPGHAKLLPGRGRGRDDSAALRLPEDPGREARGHHPLLQEGQHQCEEQRRDDRTGPCHEAISGEIFERETKSLFLVMSAKLITDGRLGGKNSYLKPTVDY